MFSKISHSSTAIAPLGLPFKNTLLFKYFCGTLLNKLREREKEEKTCRIEKLILLIIKVDFRKRGIYRPLFCYSNR